MNPNRLNEIRARTEKATPGPWERTGTRGQLIYSILSVDEYDISSVVLDVWGEKVDANAEFIAHAREDIPHLLGDVQSLNIQLECRIEERDQLGLDLNMANLNLDDLAEQLAESQRREQAAVELLIHGCETCANARVDGRKNYNKYEQ